MTTLLSFLFVLGGYLAMCGSSIDPRIKAVVEFFGGFPKEMRLFMRRLCPTLILHGESDSIIPISEAHYLQKLLEDKKIPHEIKVYPGNTESTLELEPGVRYRVIRGGAYDGNKDKNDATYRGYLDGSQPYPKVGFRCAKDAK